MHKQCNWTLSKQLPKVVPYHLVFDENQVIRICRPRRLYQGQFRAKYWINIYIHTYKYIYTYHIERTCFNFLHFRPKRLIFVLTCWRFYLHIHMCKWMSINPLLQSFYGNGLTTLVFYTFSVGNFSCITFYIFNISYCRLGDNLIYIDFIVNNKKQIYTAAL